MPCDPVLINLTPPASAPVVVTVDSVAQPISLIVQDAADGAPGKSAYQLAVDEGFIGTLTQWLASLNATGETVSDPLAFYILARD
jgi:hypothetical protein